MFNLDKKNFLKITFLVSLFALFSAYFIEYVLGHQPCNLCLIERIPYFFAVIIISLGLFLDRFEKFIFISLCLIFVSATILSFYHLGIEQGFFKESLVCISNNEIDNLSKEDLLKEFQKTVINCKDVEFTLFGLSLATINVIISFILSVITFKLFLNYEKNRSK